MNPDHTPPELMAQRSVAAITSALAQVAEADHQHLDGGGWPMAADALTFLREIVTALEPSHIVEFGSGVSTVELARAADRLGGPCAVTTIENDPAACRAVRAELEHAGVSATVQFAPLVVRRVDGRHLPVYDLRRPRFGSHAAPGLIVVDGPPSMLGGREGSLRQALSLAMVGTILLLDDARREADAEVFAAVARTYHECLETVECDGFDRGMGAFVVTAPVRVGFGDDIPTSAHSGGSTARSGDSGSRVS